MLSDNGVASFAHLQADLSAGRNDRMVYYAFDLLHLDTTSLLQEPLSERKSRLEDLLKKDDGSIRYSEHFEQLAGLCQYAAACLEGVISNR